MTKLKDEVKEWTDRLKKEGILTDDPEKNLLLCIRAIRELKLDGIKPYDIFPDIIEARMRKIKNRGKGPRKDEE